MRKAVKSWPQRWLGKHGALACSKLARLAGHGCSLVVQYRMTHDRRNGFQQVSTCYLTDGHKKTISRIYSMKKKPRLSSWRAAQCPFALRSPKFENIRKWGCRYFHHQLDFHRSTMPMPTVSSWHRVSAAPQWANSHAGLQMQHGDSLLFSSPFPFVKASLEAKAWKGINQERKATTLPSEHTKHTMTFTSEVGLTHLYFKGQVDTRHFSCSSFICEGNNMYFWVLLPQCQPEPSCRGSYNDIQPASLGEPKVQPGKIPLRLIWPTPTSGGLPFIHACEAAGTPVTVQHVSPPLPGQFYPHF